MTRVLRHIEEFRKGAAVIEIRDARDQPRTGMGVSVEQLTHAFLFGLVLPDLSSFSEGRRQRCLLRAQEVFNRTFAPGDPWFHSPDRLFVDVSQGEGGAKDVPLGRLRCSLDNRGAGEKQLVVVVSGRTVGMSPYCRTTLSEREMGQRVANLYTLLLSHRSVGGILWEGFVDREPSVQDNGLLREDLAPKPAFQMLRKLVGLVWHSRSCGLTDPRGQFRFRGFFGDYRLIVSAREVSPDVLRVCLIGSGATKEYALRTQENLGARHELETSVLRYTDSAVTSQVDVELAT